VERGGTSQRGQENLTIGVLVPDHTSLGRVTGLDESTRPENIPWSATAQA
jgi:hypothetical protein